MIADVDSLIAPLSEEAPSGPDMSYDAARQEIEAAFDRSVSDDGGASSDVDWPATTRLILGQCEQTRDIWLPVYLMRSGARAGDLETVETGAALLAGLFETLWDSVHPQLDEYGFQGRKGPCESLTRIGEFLNPFRGIALLSHQRLGVYSGADFERFFVNGDSESGYGMFRALLEETSDEDLQAIVDRVDGIEQAIRRADAVLTENAGGDTGTNFQPTYDMLKQIRAGVGKFMRTPDVDTSDNSAEGDVSWSSSDDDDAASGGGSFGGRINSREDVIRAMDAISDYYKRKEPGSAVPFALRRAREWVSLDFMAILEDIAPGSMEEARRVLMASRGEATGGGSSSDGESW